jgi:hypothetical protein
MKICILALADYVTDQGGKLTIVGAFDKISSSKFPFVANPFGVAVKGYVEKNDYGKKRKITIELKSSDGKIKVFRVGGHVGFASKKSVRVESMTLKFMLANIEFKSAGFYVLECKTGSKILSTSQLEVVKIRESTAPKKALKKKVTKKR